MFAIAIWDAPRRRLVLARDRFGIKPLLLPPTSASELSFASELRALPRGEIDLDALEAFLAFNSIPAPLTIFREIRKLPPGHVLAWDGGEPRARALRAARARCRRTRCDATTRRSWSRSCGRGCATRCARTSSSDVPVGVLLSGGVDSSLLAALAAQELAEPLRTFSIGFEERVVRRARRRAPRGASATRPTTTSSSLRPDAALLLPALAEAFDEPFADSSALPTYLVSRARGRRREGRALRRGRRRALRRLLHLRRRPAGAARRAARVARAAARRAAADLDGAGELRLQGEALRRAARTCRRSSATTPGRRSSRRTRAPS